MKLFRLSPLTQKRLDRFRRSRVAFWSLRLLGVLYVLSLCAELICNDKPLVMRFDGELSFPFLLNQPPEAVQKATGETTHVNYRAFVESETFGSHPGDFALFAPVPYAPGETLDTKDLERDKIVTISLVPDQPIGRFNLTQDLTIARQDSCAQFFPNTDLRDGRTALGDLVALTPRSAKRSPAASAARPAAPTRPRSRPSPSAPSRGSASSSPWPPPRAAPAP